MRIKNNQSRVIQLGGGFRLLPGLNDNVPADVWDAFKGTPAIASLLKDKALQVLDATPFPKLPEEEAIALVGETVDRAQLAKWAQEEKRAAVREAIGAQLKAITPTPTPKPQGADNA